MSSPQAHAVAIAIAFLAFDAAPAALADGDGGRPASQVEPPRTTTRDAVPPRLVGPERPRPGEDLRFRPRRPGAGAPYIPGPGFERVHLSGDDPAGTVVTWYLNRRTGVLVRVEERAGRYTGRRTVFRGREAQRALAEIERERNRGPRTVIR